MHIRSFTHSAAAPKAAVPQTASTFEGALNPIDTFSAGEPQSEPLLSPATLRSRTTGTTQDMIGRIQRQLDREWKFFGSQTYDTEGRLVKRGISEEDPRVFKRVGYFWEKGTGLLLDGRDQDWPWSAAFISTVHEDAEVGPQFFRSPAHARYIRDAIFKKQAGIEDAAYWGHRLTERAPQVGDMVCYSRQKGVSYDRQPLRYQSHADIVTAVRPGEIDVVGGNVGNSVSKKSVKTDENGLIVDENYNWFAVLEPKNLEQFFHSPPPESGEETYPKAPQDLTPDDVD